MINPVRVKEIFVDCLYKSTEVENNEVPEEAVITQGIKVTVAFNPIRLEANKSEIEAMLEELDDTFKKGWSFLNMCHDKNNEMWTGSHRTMEELLILGLAIKKIEYCCERDMWSMLPGAMPYIKIN